MTREVLMAALTHISKLREVIERKRVLLDELERALWREAKMIPDTVTFDRAKLRRLKNAYRAAMTRGEQQFTFEDHELLVTYAKYLIEHLERELA